MLSLSRGFMKAATMVGGKNKFEKYNFLGRPETALEIFTTYVALGQMEI